MPIFNAWCDRCPMIVLGATGPVDASRRRPWIDWIHTAKDQGALVRDYVKWDDQPASASAAAESLLRASQIAQTAPRGPAYVCFDMAMLEEKLNPGFRLPDAERYLPAPPTAALPQTANEALQMLCRAERPLILMGRTSRRSEAWKDRVRLAEMLGADVLTDLKVGASFPTKHPLHAAPPVELLSGKGTDLIRNADVILSLDWLDLAGTLTKSWDNEPVTASVIHCSVDLHSHRGWSMDYFGLPPVDLPVLAEPDCFVSQLLEAARKQDLSAPAKVRLANAPERQDPPVQAAQARSSGAITLLDLGVCLSRTLGRRDVCYAQLPIGWPGEVLNFNHPLDYVGNNGGGGLGAGPGIAVGTALALRGSNRLPVAVLGDGDFLMGDAALWTAARYRIPLLIIVANNRCYGNSARHQEKMAKTRKRPEENRWIGTRIEDPSVDIAGVSRARGLKAAGPVEDLAELPEALETAVKAVDEGQGYVLDVVIGGKGESPFVTR